MLRLEDGELTDQSTRIRKQSIAICIMYGGYSINDSEDVLSSNTISFRKFNRLQQVTNLFIVSIIFYNNQRWPVLLQIFKPTLDMKVCINKYWGTINERLTQYIELAHEYD